MSELEKMMDNLSEKHNEQDRAKAELRKEVREKLGRDAGMLGLELKHLQEDMINENYESLNESFNSIKSKLGNIDEVQDKLQIIEAGLKDREASKYNAAMTAVKELKEAVQD